MSNERQVLGRRVSPERARAWSLVLSSMRIPHALKQAGQGRVYLVVSEAHLESAEKQIRLWRSESMASRRRRLPVESDFHGVPLTGLYVTLMLLCVHLVASGRFDVPLREAGVLDVGRVGGGEVWRIVTAVSLHSDWGHLFSNLFFGWILLTGLVMSIGNGRALCLTLIGGVSANCVNVAIHSTRYVSLGFSNAVFAMLGALVSLQLVRDRAGRRSGGLLAVGAGLALFGLSGTGEGSDLTGHLAGFVTGLILGVLPGFRRQDQQKKWGSIYGVAAGAVFVGAWLLALSVN